MAIVKLYSLAIFLRDFRGCDILFTGEWRSFRALTSRFWQHVAGDKQVNIPREVNRFLGNGKTVLQTKYRRA